MGFIEAILLAMLQGATEFLPISSSGHLILGERFLGIEEPQLLFSVTLHLGTLLAVMLYYRREIMTSVTDVVAAAADGLQERSIGAFRLHAGARLALLLVLATLPTAVVGLGIDRVLDPGEGAEVISPAMMPMVICVSLILTGFILFSMRFYNDAKRPERGGNWTLWNITPGVAILIGLAQGLAALPGFSRSGLTIAAALWLGAEREESAHFSFLLSIPAVLGALILKFDPALFAGVDGGRTALVYGVSALVAGVIGYVSIIWLVGLLKRAQFHHFAWYCWIVGAGGLLALGMMS
ncbi:UDP-diphosphatase [Lujinxingia litoralis]|uniref:Undecaprenyl-diphosphatase n=1 Tax=Lujinxingia litoralis TaxID=2211119 RepID=A0A328C182_9DELT|nr:undecaprenyl-diphosphate phosphatase [Lujinxingia litoralis]RAL20049.1 UDP-diphosphatase [Lujinxingia litoralis]